MCDRTCAPETRANSSMPSIRLNVESQSKYTAATRRLKDVQPSALGGGSKVCPLGVSWPYVANLDGGRDTDGAAMESGANPGIQEALDSVHEAMDFLFEALREPYETLATAEPDAVLGSPVATVAYRTPVDLGRIAKRVEENGRNAWALKQVDERQGQIRGLLQDYEKGLYSTMSVSEWLAMLSKFREAALADVMTAKQAPKGWARINLAQRNNHEHPLDKPVLSPKDIAPQLGLDERAVRRRIADGRLGPWKKEGGRWRISRTAFLQYWDRLASDSDQPHPPGAGEPSSGGDGLDHLHL